MDHWIMSGTKNNHISVTLGSLTSAKRGQTHEDAIKMATVL